MSDAASPEGAAPDATCVIRRVVTSISFFGRRVPVESMAFPEGATFTLDATASMFGLTKRTIWNELSEKRARFDRPMYRHRRRLLTEHDIQVLRELFRVRVRVKS